MIALTIEIYLLCGVEASIVAKNVIMAEILFLISYFVCAHEENAKMASYRLVFFPTFRLKRSSDFNEKKLETLSYIDRKLPFAIPNQDVCTH